jgi:hypothetical protein
VVLASLMRLFQRSRLSQFGFAPGTERLDRGVVEAVFVEDNSP